MTAIKKSIIWQKWRHPAALLFYTALALWLTWPLIINARSALAGSSTDALMHYWNGWLVKQTLASGQLPLSTDYIFYPEGVSLILHNMAWLSILPWLALQTIFDGLLAYNIIFMANLVLAGYATFLLASHLTGNTPAALIAGLIYLAWPYRISQLDHPNLISTYWIPLLFLFLLVAIREARWRYALAAGLALALIGFTRWQLLIPAGILLALFLLFTAREWFVDRRHRLILLAFIITAVILLAPAAGLLLSQQMRSPDSFDTLLREGEEAVMQSDLLAFLTPTEDHPLFGEAAESFYDRYYADRSSLRRFPVYIGFITLVLAIIGAWQRPRLSLPWVVMALVIILIALGPVLRLNGRLLPEVPTLYRFLEPLKLLRLMRVPERYNIVLALPIAVLAAYGVSALLEKFPANLSRTGQLKPVALFALLAILILIDYGHSPIPLQADERSPYFEQMAGETGNLAIINLPIDAIQSKVHLFDQTIHGQPLLHGKVSRLPADAYEFIDANPLLRSVRAFDEMPPWITDVSQQFNALATQGFGAILIYKNQIGSDRIERMRRYLIFSPFYEDDEVVIYRSQPKAGRDFSIEAELAPGLGPVDSLFTAACGQPGQQIEVDVAWGTSAVQTVPFNAQLVVLDQTDRVVQSKVYPLDPVRPEASLPANALFWVYYPFQLAPDLAPGDYDLGLALVKNEFSDPVGEVTSLGSLTVSDNPCPHELPEQAQNADALFGSEIRLLGYEMQRPSPDRLGITLHWRGEQRMGTDYKVFVHIFDPATGLPVAQDDAMPRRGGLPTRLWAPGDLVTDSIPIEIGEVAPGNYGIAIGVYDPATGERLPILIEDGKLADDGRFITGEVVTIGPG